MILHAILNQIEMIRTESVLEQSVGIGIGIGITNGFCGCCTVSREKVNSLSSLRNTFAGSWAALDQSGQPERVCLTEKLPVDITVSRASTSSTSPSGNGEAVGEGAGPSKVLAGRQWLLLIILMLSTLTSSFAICLFPPFFPKIVSAIWSEINPNSVNYKLDYLLTTNALTTKYQLIVRQRTKVRLLRSTVSLSAPTVWHRFWSLHSSAKM